MSRYLGCCEKKRVHPQDGPWSWLVCACAVLSNLLFTGFGISYGIMVPVLMREFKTNREKTAWVGSIAVALSCLLSPISCSLSGRFGCRIVAISGSFICIVSLLSSSFVTRLELLYFTHGLLFGVGNNFTYTTPFLVVSERFTKWRSLALCLLNVGTAAGVLIYGPCLQLMLDSFGWRHTFHVMASISVVGVIFACSYGSKSKVVHQSSVNGKQCKGKQNDQCESNKIVMENNESDNIWDKKNEDALKYKGKFRQILRAYRSVWGIRMYTVITLSSTLACVAQYLPVYSLAKHSQELGFSADSVADLYSYLGIAAIVSRILAGLLLGLTATQSKYLYQTSLFANGLVTLFLPIVSGYYGLVGYALVYGASDGLFWAVLYVLIISSVSANMRGTALGMQQFLISISLLLGPPLAGWIADIHDSYKPTFYMSGIISILAGLMVFLLPCGKKDLDIQMENLNESTQKNWRIGNKDTKIPSSNLSHKWKVEYGHADSQLSLLFPKKGTLFKNRNHFNEENEEKRAKTKLRNDKETSTSLLIEIADRETVL